MMNPSLNTPSHDAAALQAALLRIEQLEQATRERDAHIEHIIKQRDANQFKIKELTIERDTKQLKIDQLTYELSRYKRHQFGKTSEVLSKVQQDLFIDNMAEDFAAIET